jgi:uncharacterized membrane protein YfhO
VPDAYVSNSVLEDVAGRFRAAYADLDTLYSMSKKVQQNPVTIKKIKDSHLTGKVKSDTDRELMFTIPYDTGWTCLVDGKNVKIKKVLDVFMAVDVPSGEHSIEMVYVPDGFIIGRNISIAALLVLIIYLAFGRKQIVVYRAYFSKKLEL